MPVLSTADKNRMRQRPLASRFTFFVYDPTVVWQGRIKTGTSPSAGDRTLTVTEVAGDHTDVLALMTCTVVTKYNTKKSDPSKVRIKTITDIGSGDFTLTLADNAIDWTEGDVLSIKRLFEIWPRIPWIDPSDGTVYKDRDIAWSSDNDAQPPKANGGPPAYAKLNEYGFADVVFADDSSYACPDGGGVSSYLWDAVGGSPAVQAGAEASFTVTYRYTTAGFYYVAYKVTDANAVDSMIRYIPVIIDDGTLQATYVNEFVNRSYDGLGWTLAPRISTLYSVEKDPTWYDGAPCFLIDTACIPALSENNTETSTGSSAAGTRAQSITVDSGGFLRYVDIEVLVGTKPDDMDLLIGESVTGDKVADLAYLEGMGSNWYRFEYTGDTPVWLGKGRQYTILWGTGGTGAWSRVLGNPYQKGRAFYSSAWQTMDHNFRLYLSDTLPITGGLADDREKVRWYGWLIEDSLNRSAFHREVAFRAVSTGHILTNIPSFPTGLRLDASPADWYEYAGLCIDSVAHILFHWHSTVFACADYHPVGEWATRGRPGENCRAGNLLDQIDDVLGACKGTIRCDRQGSLRAIRHEWFLSGAERAARDIAFALTQNDFQTVNSGIHRHRYDYREARVSGVDGSDNPYLAGSPGVSPLDGGRPMEVQNLAPVHQAELNQWASQELSLANNKAFTRIKMSGEYDAVDPAYGDFLQGGDLSYYDLRNSPGPYSMVGVSIQFDAQLGYSVSEWTLQPSPSALSSLTITPPSIPSPPTPPALDPGPALPDLPTDTIAICILGTVGTSVTGSAQPGAGVVFCECNPGGSWTWATRNTGFGATYVIESLTHNPGNVTQVACIARSEASSGAAVWVNDDITNSSQSWAKCTNATDAAMLSALETLLGETVSWLDLNLVYGYSVDSETSMLVCAMRYSCANESGGSGDSHSYCRLARSTDWGDTWEIGDRIEGYGATAVGVSYSYTMCNATGHGSGDSDGQEGKGELVYHNGLLYAAGIAPLPAGANQRGNLAVSSDHSATWVWLCKSSEGVSGAEVGFALTKSSTGILSGLWAYDNGGTDTLAALYTASLSPSTPDPSAGGFDFTTLKTLLYSDWASGENMASNRQGIAVYDDDAYALLWFDYSASPPATVYRGADGAASSSSVNLTGDARTLSASGQRAIALWSCLPGEESSDSGDELVTYTGDKFASQEDASGNLYSIGARGFACGMILELP